jgi:lipopolysaccharide exporter
MGNSCYNVKMGYSRHAFKGSSWNASMKVLTVFVTAAKYFVLFRLLTPHDFGIAQYMIITYGILEAFTETGINTTIVQSKKSIHYFLDTAWVISILRGLLISILMILSGFWMRNYFHEESLLLLMVAGSFIPLVKGFINPAIVSMYRELRFFHDAVYHFALIVFDACAAIVLAFWFHSAYVFVLSMLSAALFEVVISFLFFVDKPRFYAVRSRLQEILLNAKSLNPAAILGYLVENIDNLLVGKVVGTTALGIYSNAYSLSHKFTLQFAKSVQYGTFPVYVEIAHQKLRLKRAFWRAAAVSLTLFSLISLPFIFFPAPLVLFFSGDQWGEVVPILPYLAIAGVVQSFVSLSTAVFTATKNYKWLNLTMFVNFVALVAFVVILGQSGGLHGAVLGVLISRLLVIPIVLIGLWQSLSDL